MTWTTHYLPPEVTRWKGRVDAPLASSFFQIIRMMDLREPMPSSPDRRHAFALLGFRCDEGVRRNHGRTGAEEGPLAIRKQLSRLPVQKQTFTCFDAGDILCADDNLEEAQQALSTAVSLLLKHGMTPIVLGGGHELAWGHYCGIADVFLDKQLGIVNFDAHFDMRPLLPNHQGSSGTGFLQIAAEHIKNKRHLDYNCIGIQHAGNTRELFDTAKTHKVNTLLADDLHQGYLDKCVNFIDRVIDQNQLIYLTLCLDVFAAAYAPAVSAPQVMGVTPWQVMPLIRQLAASGKTISYDIAELSPKFDIDHRTAKLAANFIYEIIHHHNEHYQGLHNGHHLSS